MAEDLRAQLALARSRLARREEKLSQAESAGLFARLMGAGPDVQAARRAVTEMEREVAALEDRLRASSPPVNEASAGSDARTELHELLMLGEAASEMLQGAMIAFQTGLDQTKRMQRSSRHSRRTVFSHELRSKARRGNRQMQEAAKLLGEFHQKLTGAAWTPPLMNIDAIPVVISNWGSEQVTEDLRAQVDAAQASVIELEGLLEMVRAQLESG